MSSRCFPGSLLWCAALILCGAESLYAQPEVAAGGESAESEYARFREIAGSCRIETESGRTLSLREQSLMNWTNPSRNNELGSIFVWEDRGRPDVIGTVFTYESAPLQQIRTKLALHSLAGEPLTATRDGSVLWKPNRPGVVWKRFSESPEVSASAPLRLSQMRSLARQFDVEMTIGNRNTIEKLRLVPQPLYRYEPDGGDVRDGAIFAQVTATDPEALLLIEAISSGDRLEWRYTFARFHFVQLVARQGETEVWRAEPELDQRLNTAGDVSFQDRVYTTMVVDARPIAAP